MLLCKCFLGLRISRSHLNAVMLQELETELAEDLEERHVWVLLLSFLWVPEGKTDAIPKRNKQSH